MVACGVAILVASPAIVEVVVAEEYRTITVTWNVSLLGNCNWTSSCRHACASLNANFNMTQAQAAKQSRNSIVNSKKKVEGKANFVT